MKVNAICRALFGGRFDGHLRVNLCFFKMGTVIFILIECPSTYFTVDLKGSSAPLYMT